MNKFIFLPIAALLLLLGACSATPGLPDELLSGDPAAADSFLGTASTVEERSLRLHFAVFAYAKLGTHRVLTADPEDGSMVLGNIIRLRQAVGGFTVEGYDPYFIETDMRDTALSLIDVVVGVAEDTITRALFHVLDGIDIGTARERFALRAEQAALLQAIVVDIKRNLQDFRDGKFTYTDAVAAVNGRLDGFEDQLAAFQ